MDIKKEMEKVGEALPKNKEEVMQKLNDAKAPAPKPAPQ